MRDVCVQFQPDRVRQDAARVRQELRAALPDAEVDVGQDDGGYENFVFQAVSPEDAIAKIRIVLDSPEVGRAARSSCILTCQDERGWDDYLLLHHYDSTLTLDAPAARPAV